MKQQEVPSQRNWREQAACRDLHVDLFYGPDMETTTARVAREKVARAVCAECPVKEDCLAAAVKGNEWGIWGGTSQHQRRRLNRKKKRHLSEASVVVRRAVPAVLKTQVLAERQGWDGSTVVIRMEETDVVDSPLQWVLLKDGQVKYVSNDQQDAWMMFGSWTVTL